MRKILEKIHFLGQQGDFFFCQGAVFSSFQTSVQGKPAHTKPLQKDNPVSDRCKHSFYLMVFSFRNSKDCKTGRTKKPSSLKYFDRASWPLSVSSTEFIFSSMTK